MFEEKLLIRYSQESIMRS